MPNALPSKGLEDSIIFRKLKDRIHHVEEQDEEERRAGITLPQPFRMIELLPGQAIYVISQVLGLQK